MTAAVMGHSVCLLWRMHLPLLLVAVCILAVASGDKCPEDYARLSDQHSYCLPKNDQCTIVQKGVTQADKDTILKEHNVLRSNVANGQIDRPDLPTASDMIEMTWDNEIAAIAQKYMEQCNFNHDCNACRGTSNFAVGQNLAQGSASCSSTNCQNASDYQSMQPDWKGTVDLWYNEVVNITADLVNDYQFGEDYGHFSQLAWSKTWKVGCGYTAYMNGDNTVMNLYGCNYAIAGNGANVSIYMSGNPASNCPVNSKESESYPGLCKLNDPNKSPIDAAELQTEKSYIFNCDFSENNEDCVVGLEGTNKWLYYDRVFGTVLQGVMTAGDNSTLNFQKTIQPTTPFCMVLNVRLGPNVAGQDDNNVFEANIQQPPSMPTWVVDVGIPGWYWFAPTSLTCFQADTTISITFTVPDGAPPQFVEVRQIYAYPGNCS